MSVNLLFFEKWRKCKHLNQILKHLSTVCYLPPGQYYLQCIVEEALSFFKHVCKKRAIYEGYRWFI